MLAQKLQKIIAEKDLTAYRTLIERTAVELGVSHLECAAALAHLYVPEQAKPAATDKTQALKKAAVDRNTNSLTMVSYRLDVGRKHRIAVNKIKKLLIEESGVERKHIGYVEIHQSYTLIKLPDGMPPDIYNHLKTVQINQQVLNIKRLGKSKNFKRNKINRRKQQKNKQANNSVMQTTSNAQSNSIESS